MTDVNRKALERRADLPVRPGRRLPDAASMAGLQKQDKPIEESSAETAA